MPLLITTQLEVFLIIHVTYYIEHNRFFFNFIDAKTICYVSGAVCQLKHAYLEEKSVTVIVPEILTSVSCNGQVLHMCMVTYICTQT